MEIQRTGREVASTVRGRRPAVHEFCRSGIDDSLIDGNWKFSNTQRIEKFTSFRRMVEAVRRSRPIAPTTKCTICSG